MNPFMKGLSVDNPAFVKNVGMGLMGALPVTLSAYTAFAANHPGLFITSEDATTIVNWLMAVIGIVSHVISSDKIGFPSTENQAKLKE